MNIRNLHLEKAMRAALLFLLLGAVGMIKVYATYDFSAVCPTGQILYYTITDANNHYVTLSCPGSADYNNCWSGFTKPTGNITLPESVEHEGVNYVVTAIGNYAFCSCKGLIGSLTIPNTVTTIGEYAFDLCGFNGNLIIGNSVIEIGKSAFGSDGFTGNLTLPNSVTTIGRRAFIYCSGFTGSLTFGNSVTTIGEMAFENCSGFTGSITIPNSVIYIEENPFIGCSGLEQIIVDSGNTEYDSRNNCNAIIKTSTNQLITGCNNTIIPNTVTSIEACAFWNCYGLTSIDIPNSVTYIGNEAFRVCTNLTSLSIGNSVSYIYDRAFADCYSLEQIIVNQDNMYYDSRENCNAIIKTSTNELVVGCKNTVIPSSVTSIRNYAFESCIGLTSIEIPNAVTSIGRCAFYNCSGLTSIELPNSLITIGDSAFWGCSGLTGGLTIPNSVISIGYMGFVYCDGLTSLNIGSSVTSIGPWAFYRCSGLTGNLTIPNSVTNIGDRAFQYCNAFTSMTILSEVPPVLGESVFYGANMGIPVYVPCTFSEVYQNAEGWNEFTNFHEMCSGVITVTANPSEYGTASGGGMFDGGEICTVTAVPNEGCFFTYWSENGHVVSGEESYSFTVAGDRDLVANFAMDGIIVFSDANVKNLCVTNWDTDGDGELSYYEANAVTDLEDVFRGNSTITTFDELQYFTGLVSIGYEAFYNCTNLASVSIPNSVISIGHYAFCYCYSLTSVNIPNSVISIEYAAFFKCNSLILMTIPNSVTFIGDSAFNGCSGLEQIIVEIDNTVYDSRNNSNAIIKTSTNELVAGCKNTIIPNSVTSIGYQAFGWCSSLTSLIIPNSVTSIENGAFGECTGLASITIPNSVTLIGDNVFYDCSSLTSIEIPSSVTYIGHSTLSLCSALEQIIVMSSNEVYDSRENCNAIIHTSTNELISGCMNTIIPNSVTSIGRWAFQGHYHLASIIIPNSISIIEFCAFGGCSNLSSITVMAGNPPVLGGDVFVYVNKSIPVYVPAGTVAAYQAALGWNEFTNYHEYLSTSYTITVSANPEEGGSVIGGSSYDQGATCTLTATANEGYTFTNWTKDGVEVSTNATYSFTVTEDAAYVANFSSGENHWSVDVYQYPYNMSVVGIIEIYGEEQQNSTLEIGAFCGDVCRGTQRLTYFPQVNRYLVFLTLYGDADDMMDFRLYDHALGQELDLACTSTITFVPDGFMGTAFDPYVFDFGIMTVDQISNFSEGYNWWSTYIEQEGIDGMSMLQEGLGNNGVTIRSQASGYTDYYAGYGWFGSLTSINNESSYRVITNTACSVTMTGVPVLPSQHPITLSQGWTWIGYVSSTVMDITTAMAGLTPTTGDKLKSQHGFSDYYPGYGWFGSLNTLEPGMGLMYYSTSSTPVTFTYPDNAKGGEPRANMTPENNHWVPNTYAYPDNMTVMAVVDLDDEELASDGYELAVFANGECRGSVKLIFAEPINRHVAFLTVSGKDAAELSFRLYDTETGKEYYDAEESLTFTANAIVGDADNLYAIHFRGTTGMDEFASKVRVYPNPVNCGENFSIGLDDDVNNLVRVEIVNALGVVVETVHAPFVQTLTAPNVAGVYTLLITVEGKGTIIHKLIVK